MGNGQQVVYAACGQRGPSEKKKKKREKNETVYTRIMCILIGFKESSHCAETMSFGASDGKRRGVFYFLFKNKKYKYV